MKIDQLITLLEDMGRHDVVEEVQEILIRFCPFFLCCTETYFGGLCNLLFNNHL